jgi:phage gp45-like
MESFYPIKQERSDLVLYIQHGGKIRLTRGDTAILKVDIVNDITGDEYIVANDDTLTFTMAKNYDDERPLIQKTIKGSNSFHIEPKDTSNLEFGEYIYDVELVTASGDVYTVIEPVTFEILKEVTCR